MKNWKRFMSRNTRSPLAVALLALCSCAVDAPESSGASEGSGSVLGADEPEGERLGEGSTGTDTSRLVAPGSGTPSLEQARQALAQKVGADRASISCWDPVYIRSQANGRYLSVRVEEGGLMRASSTSKGPWERFFVCRDSSTQRTTIRANVNGLYVSARLDEGGLDRGLVRASVPSAARASWEDFYTTRNPTTSGQTQTTVLIAEANDRYVSTRLDEGGIERPLLRASSWERNPWELYSW
jgi:hypothetical protein